jgi:hypothetical protein
MEMYFVSMKPIEASFVKLSLLFLSQKYFLIDLSVNLALSQKLFKELEAAALLKYHC